MPVRQAQAEWVGALRGGHGRMRTATGSYDGAYSFGSRFEEAAGTNPEELIAAAHAGCFSMDLAGRLGDAGFMPTRVRTTAQVRIDPMQGGGFAITRIDLLAEAEVPGVDEATFQRLAQEAKLGCPVSKALAAVPLVMLEARLLPASGKQAA